MVKDREHAEMLLEMMELDPRDYAHVSDAELMAHAETMYWEMEDCE